MPFNTGDKVRFKDDGAFAYIHAVTLPGQKYEVFIHNKKGKFYPADADLEADAPVSNGTWCVSPSRGNTTFVIIGRRDAVSPKKDESAYEYHVKMDTGPGLSDWVNGAALYQFRAIARPSTEAEFFTALQNQTKLVHLPRAMQDKDFAIAYRGDDRKPGVIYTSGFAPRTEKVSPIFRTVKEEGGVTYPQFDIETSSGVCASHNPAAAGLFPLIKESAASLQDTTYVYAFFAYQPFQTVSIQASAKRMMPEFAANIEALLRGSEIVLGAEGAPAQTILVAFEVNRTWNAKDWTKGCRYDVVGFMRNEGTFYAEDAAYDRCRRNLESSLWTALHGKSSPVFS